MDNLISRQAAIKAVRDFPNTDNGWSDTYDKAFIISALEEIPSAESTGAMDEAIQEYIEKGYMKPTQQWIPCSERLPCEDGRYLVSYWLMKDMPWISVMYYGKPTFPEKDHPCFYVSDGEYGDVEYDDIVAWMPLPEPYRKDEEKGEAE